MPLYCTLDVALIIYRVIHRGIINVDKKTKITVTINNNTVYSDYLYITYNIINDIGDICNTVLAKRQYNTTRMDSHNITDAALAVLLLIRQIRSKITCAINDTHII